MGWTMTETQFNSWQGQEVFLFHKNIKNSSGVHPASYSEYKRTFLRLSSRAVSPSVQQVGHEANHSLSFCAEVKNECGYTFALKHAFMVCTGRTRSSPPQ